MVNAHHVTKHNAATMTENPHECSLATLESLLSEGRNPNSMDLDMLSSRELLARINDEDHRVAPAIEKELDAIAQLTDLIVDRLRKGGRLIYSGAGTSGRLGVLDAAECRPTFSVPDGLVIGVIAGGERALKHAVEGAEDDRAQGAMDLKQLALSPLDVVVGLSASGRTPYVCGALEFARSKGCVTGAIACSPNAAMFAFADIAIAPVVGPEVLTGSTRMKSGTAQKLVLNMLSTATMVKLGKAYQNLMVDVNASNAKLKARAIRIVMLATDCDEETAKAALSQTDYHAKTAIVMLLTQCSASDAAMRLAQHQGYIRDAIA